VEQVDQTYSNTQNGDQFDGGLHMVQSVEKKNTKKTNPLLVGGFNPKLDDFPWWE